MRCELRSLPAAILVAALLAAGVSADEKAGAGKKPDLTPLIRTDLLNPLPPEPAAPIRDIFRPGQAVAAPMPVGAPEVQEDHAGEEPGLEAPTETAAEEPALDLTYIGYVTSGRKIVGLIILGGQALAVAEGEEVVPGVKVASISPDRIEVVGPDGKRTSVPIQGEQP